MRIIKLSEEYREIKKPSWIYQDSCHFCKSIIEYSDLDVFLHIGERRYFIKRACCDNILELNTDTHEIIDKEIKF